MKLPLKAIVRGFFWTFVPITWKNRRIHKAKLWIKETGSLYCFVCTTMWLKKYFILGDYRKSRSVP